MLTVMCEGTKRTGRYGQTKSNNGWIDGQMNKRDQDITRTRKLRNNMLNVVVDAIFPLANRARAIDDEASLLARLVLLQSTCNRERHARDQGLEHPAFFRIFEPIVVYQRHLDWDGAGP